MIVVVADGSQAGLRAVEWAAREAADRVVTLHVLHAVSAAVGGAKTPPEDGLVDAARAIGEGADAVLKQARAAALAAEPRILVTTAIVPGDPRPALIEAAREAELLVIGDHGLADHGLGTFGEPPVNSAGLGVPPCVLCDVVVVGRPPSLHGLDIEIEAEPAIAPSTHLKKIIRLPPAKWLFDPADVERDDADLRGLLGAVGTLELHSRPDRTFPDERV
ncbi:universal stress protein [Actinomadura sp. 6N118]|uniref:universal stress protein n=1 Tax=Actinomadura sp. 6N118 TaxID=3375151 RepID=UPI0037AEC3C1